MSNRQRTVAKVGAFIWIPAVLAMFAVFAIESDSDPQDGLSALATVFAVVYFIALSLTFAAIVLMIKHIYTESQFSDGWKTRWTAMLFFFNALAAPFYWSRHMAAQKDRPPASGPGAE